MMQRRISTKELGELRDDFLERLGTGLQRRRPFVAVIGGTNGSGKTVAARTLAQLSDSIHVQANSARFLLAKRNLPWGSNVHFLIRDVLKDLVAREWSVVLDGMVLEEKERQLVKTIARKHGASFYFNAVLCEPQITIARARLRYADKAESTFDDWRCNPDNFEKGYIESITPREKLAEELVSQRSTVTEDRVSSIDNSGSELDLGNRIQIVWKGIREKL